MAARAGRAEVVYLGEVHDNPHHHRRQVAALEAMLAAGLRPGLAFEMLPEGQQAATEDALRAGLGGAELDRRLGWSARGWPEFEMYRPLFEAAARHRLPVFAIDLDPGLARRIAREGPAAAGDRRPALASLLVPDPGREAAIADAIRQAHCGVLPERVIPSMVESWHARNVTMARRLADALGRVSPVVVIIGRGHQDGGGLPAQLAALRPGTRQLVVGLEEAGPPGAAPPAAVGEDRSPADIVWVTPVIERPDPCEGLRQRFR